MLLAEALIESVSSDWVRWFIHWFFEILISLLAVFLVLLVLVQRGRGGGIAGALGGMGGNSAFGTKAGDTFTWITYGTATIWILLAMLTIKTFTDPVQDKARRTAQQEQEEEEPLSPLDIGNPTGETNSAGGGGGKLQDEGAFFEKEKSPATDGTKEPDPGASGTEKEDEKPATTPADESEKKAATAEPDKEPSDEPK